MSAADRLSNTIQLELQRERSEGETLPFHILSLANESNFFIQQERQKNKRAVITMAQVRVFSLIGNSNVRNHVNSCRANPALKSAVAFQTLIFRS